MDNLHSPLTERPTPSKAPDGVERVPFSTSESLARGLVSRLINEWDENDKRYWETIRAQRGARGTSKLPLKRAQGYRVLRERSLALIPEGHQLIVASHGDQHGLDKRAGFSIVHWRVMTELRRLEVAVTYGKPGWRLPLRWGLFVLADHALQRMFYRLRTLNDGDVLTELEHGARVICAWYPFLITHSKENLSIGVPTLKGMLLLKRVPTSAPFSPCDFIATTWISDELVGTRRSQSAALKEARCNNGLVMQVGEEYLLLTRDKNVDRFETKSEPFANVFYSEMIRHLPMVQELPVWNDTASRDVPFA